jgi:hypothetical protein
MSYFVWRGEDDTNIIEVDSDNPQAVRLTVPFRYARSPESNPQPFLVAVRFWPQAGSQNDAEWMVEPFKSATTNTASDPADSVPGGNGVRVNSGATFPAMADGAVEITIAPGPTHSGETSIVEVSLIAATLTQETSSALLQPAETEPPFGGPISNAFQVTVALKGQAPPA